MSFEVFKAHPNYALHYNKYPAIIEGHSDVHWTSNQQKLNSQPGTFLILLEEQYLKNRPNRHASLALQ